MAYDPGGPYEPPRNAVGQPFVCRETIIPPTTGTKTWRILYNGQPTGATGAGLIPDKPGSWGCGLTFTVSGLAPIVASDSRSIANAPAAPEWQVTASPTTVYINEQAAVCETKLINTNGWKVSARGLWRYPPGSETPDQKGGGRLAFTPSQRGTYRCKDELAWDTTTEKKSATVEAKERSAAPPPPSAPPPPPPPPHAQPPPPPPPPPPSVKNEPPEATIKIDHTPNSSGVVELPAGTRYQLDAHASDPNGYQDLVELILYEDGQEVARAPYIEGRLGSVVFPATKTRPNTYRYHAVAKDRGGLTGNSAVIVVKLFEPCPPGTMAAVGIAAVGAARPCVTPEPKTPSITLAHIGPKEGTLGQSIDFPISATVSGDPARTRPVRFTTRLGTLIPTGSQTARISWKPKATGTIKMEVTACLAEARFAAVASSTGATCDREGVPVTVRPAESPCPPGQQPALDGGCEPVREKPSPKQPPVTVRPEPIALFVCYADPTLPIAVCDAGHAFQPDEKGELDPGDRSIREYRWSFEGGNAEPGQAVMLHEFPRPGTYPVMLVVVATDGQLSAPAWLMVHVPDDGTTPPRTGPPGSGVPPTVSLSISSKDPISCDPSRRNGGVVELEAPASYSVNVTAYDPDTDKLGFQFFENGAPLGPARWANEASWVSVQVWTFDGQPEGSYTYHADVKELPDGQTGHSNVMTVVVKPKGSLGAPCGQQGQPSAPTTPKDGGGQQPQRSVSAGAIPAIHTKDFPVEVPLQGTGHEPAKWTASNARAVTIINADSLTKAVAIVSMAGAYPVHLTAHNAKAEQQTSTTLINVLPPEGMAVVIVNLGSTGNVAKDAQGRSVPVTIFAQINDSKGRLIRTEQLPSTVSMLWLTPEDFQAAGGQWVKVILTAQPTGEKRELFVVPNSRQEASLSRPEPGKPFVNAGQDQVLTALPPVTVTLAALATGFHSPTTTWSTQDDQATQITRPTSLSTGVVCLTPGVRVVTLTVTDGINTLSDDIVIDVQPPKRSALLFVKVQNEFGDPVPADVLVEKLVPGRPPVTHFHGPTTGQLTVPFTQADLQQKEAMEVKCTLRASGFAEQSVQTTVEQDSVQPLEFRLKRLRASAQDALFVEASAESPVSIGGKATLRAAARDGHGQLLDATNVAWQWRLLSGPQDATAKIESPNAASTTVSCNTQGVYVIEVTASLGALKDTAMVMVTVEPAGSSSSH